MDQEYEAIIKGHVARNTAQAEIDRDLWVPLIDFGLVADEFVPGGDKSHLLNALLLAAGSADDQRKISQAKAELAA